MSIFTIISITIVLLSIFIVWFKFEKKILRIIYHNHEIERILKGDTLSFEIYQKLKSYLSRSVELLGEAKDLLQEKDLTKEEISAVVEKICKKKEISNQTFTDKLNRILIKGNKIKKAKSDLKTLYKKNIKIEEAEHKYMLLDLWKHFKPLAPIELIDKKWRKIKLLIYPIEEIGFQGNNPLTDFRGSGLLGLQHLHTFTMSDKRADEVFKVAAGEKTWYFYAATGINISGKVIDFIEDGLCDKYFFDSTHPEVDILQFTSKFYCELFTGFNAFWVKGNYTDFMKVNTCLEEFMKKEAESIFKSTFK